MPREELKNKIISVTKELLVKNHYKDISVREVSILSGISVGTFYRCFASKEELINKFQIEMAGQIVDILSDKTINKSGIEKVFILFEVYIDLVLKRGYEYMAFLFESALEKEKFTLPQITFHTFLKNYITEAVQCGELNKKYDSEHIFKTLFSSIRGSVFYWCSHKGKSDLKTDSALTFNILINKFKSS